MGRLEKYRDLRIARKRYLISIFIFFMLVIPGVCIADYSVNSIMKDEKSIEFFRVKNVKSHLLEVNLLNRRFLINTAYIERDYERLKKLMGNRFKRP